MNSEVFLFFCTFNILRSDLNISKQHKKAEFFSRCFKREKLGLELSERLKFKHNDV